jgi:4-amino-4-deoxychorismate lyase
MSEALYTAIDGERANAVPGDDRGLQYGDGLFETVLVRRGQPRFLEAHLARLGRGCEQLGITFASLPALRAEISAVAAQAPPLAILKIIVTRGSAVRRGYAPDGAETARRIVSLFGTAPLEPSALQGVDLMVSSIGLASNPALAGIKHLSRLENVLASREARAAGVFDALLREGAGHVISGAMSNLFVVRQRQLWTPSIREAGVAGVMRGVVLRESAALAFEATERELTLADVLAADEVFVTNARIGVVPVRRVGEHRFHMNESAIGIARHVEMLDA